MIYISTDALCWILKDKHRYAAFNGFTRCCTLSEELPRKHSKINVTFLYST